MNQSTIPKRIYCLSESHRCFIEERRESWQCSLQIYGSKALPVYKRSDLKCGDAEKALKKKKITVVMA